MISAPPAEASNRCEVEVLVAKDKDNRVPFRLEIRAPWVNETLAILLSEVRPVTTEELKLRLRFRARGVLGELARLLAEKADDTLRGAGYR
jgi:hypothetical protein